MDELLEEFLKERGIPSEKIDEMKDQKVGFFLSYVFYIALLITLIQFEHNRLRGWGGGGVVAFRRRAPFKDIRKS